jgi:uncharacterized protein
MRQERDVSRRTETRARPHTLGVDDGPFQKFAAPAGPVPIVAVMMEGRDRVEAVARTAFPVDGAEVTAFLADWIAALRCHPALQAVFLGGVTIAGLAVVDVAQLARRIGMPVVVVSRRDPAGHRVDAALRAAGLAERIPTLERAPAAAPLGPRGPWVAASGLGIDAAHALVRATRQKSELPEPLRLAHMVARAYALGESRGRA